MLLGIAIMIAYVPNVVGAVVPTAWAVMWFVGPILLFKGKIELSYVHWLGIIFLFYAGFSLLWSPHGAFELMQLLALASIFIWASQLKNLRKVVIGLSIGLGVSAIIAALQYFGLAPTSIFKVTGKPSGLFVNSNVFAETSGMVLILLLIYKLWWFLPTIIPGLLVSSRAVLLGLGLTFLVWAWNKSKLLAIGFASLVIIIVTQIGVSYTIFQRLDMWKDAISGFTLFGHGLGSFAFIFPNYNQHLNPVVDFAEYMHNDFLQLIFELGIGAIPLILIIISLLKVDNVHKYALIFFIGIECFGFPLHMPVTAFMAAIVAGHLVNRLLANRILIHNVRPTISNWLAAEECSYHRISRASVSNK